MHRDGHVNYYDRHLGDYIKDTAHLSLLEHGVYSRLLDVYYTREGPIPDDQVARLIGARSKDEREALRAILEEFFELRDGAWSQDRCEREIMRYQDKQAKAKRSADARWSAHRSQSEGNANASPEHDASDMRTHSDGNAPRARPQTPDTRHQSPDTSASTRASGDPPLTRVSIAGAICIALKAEGIGSVNPGHPELLALIESGAEVQNFVVAARSAKDKGKGFAYVLGTVKGQMRDASAMASAGLSAVPTALASSGGQARARRMAEAVPGLSELRPATAGVIDTEAHDVTARRLG